MKENTAVIEQSSHTGSSGPGLFSIDPGLMIWTWIVFGLLLVVLRKFAWKPMMDSVEKREKLITDAVLQAKKTKEELEKIAETQQQLLRQAADEAQKIIDSGRVSAEKVALAIQDKAAIEVKRTLSEAQTQIAAEKERALREIREQSVDLVIAASEKLIGEILDTDMHKRIVKKQLEQM